MCNEIFPPHFSALFRMKVEIFVRIIVWKTLVRWSVVWGRGATHYGRLHHYNWWQIFSSVVMMVMMCVFAVNIYINLFARGLWLVGVGGLEKSSSGILLSMTAAGCHTRYQYCRRQKKNLFSRDNLSIMRNLCHFDIPTLLLKINTYPVLLCLT